MSESIKAFDKAAASYEEWYRTTRDAQVLRSELLCLENLLPHAGLGIEIGAGTGIFAEELANEERFIICLDPAPKMLEKAALNKLPVILATAEHIPLRKSSVEFAYLVAVLEFLSDPVRSLRSIGEILRGGVFFGYPDH